ncbi:MAG: hypothetical protein PUE21_00105 [Lachnospiraceae bacterium]|nr:hypothetical protein [Lachnospiraceae bacterium]
MKPYVKVLICIAVFFLSLTFFEIFLNRNTTDMTEEMSQASLPVVVFERAGHEINRMYGNLSETDTKYLFDGITYLGENRDLSIRIRKYESAIDRIGFQVRSADGKRLIEEGTLSEYEENKETITATFRIKDLIEQGKEYSLVLILDLDDGRSVKYYARISTETDEKVDDKINFVFDFSQKTFYKDQAEELSVYLESNAQGDNSNYAKVSIHSSLDQVSWGNLSVNKYLEPVAYIEECGSSVSQIRLEYVVTTGVGKKTKYYNVTEYFRIRQGNERMYLLDYEREMNQLFLGNKGEIYGDKIMLGITRDDLEISESTDGHTLAFVQEGALYVVNMTNNCLAKAFSFYDDEHLDERTLNRKNRIKILNIDEAGNVTFLLYGYMNCGSHEGTTGLNVITFNSSTNTLEERIFIPSTRPFEMLEADLEKLVHLSGSETLVIYFNQSIYSINLGTENLEILVNNVTDSEFAVSKNKNIIAWLEKGNTDSESVTMKNLTTGKTTKINAGTNEWIRILGFMEDDLIYGVAKKDDVVSRQYGEIIFPMYELRIQNEVSGLLKTYSQEGKFISAADISDNMITLMRMVRDEYGHFNEIEPDTILNNNENKNKERELLETVLTENSKKIVQVVLRHDMNSRTIKYMIPRFILFEGTRQVVIEETESKNQYYVYVHGKIISETAQAAKAVQLAYDKNGFVTNAKGEYVFKKGNLLLKNQIMAISGKKKDEENSSLAVCLETICLFEGYTIQAQEMLNAGMSGMEILSETLKNKEVLDLTGCPLDSILTYVNKDIPVLAVDSVGEAVLVIGFNDLNTVWMNPANGNVYKVGMNDSKEFFEKNGNCFITYIPTEE